MPIAEGGCIYSCPGVHSGASGLAGINNGHWMIGNRQDSPRPLHDMPGSPLYDKNVKIKYHDCSEADFKTREQAGADPTHRVLQLCIHGGVRTSFPQDDNPDNDVHVTLLAGQYCLWEPGVSHYWKVLGPSLIISFAWPA